MEQLCFTSKLEMDKDGTWWYVHVPKEIRLKLKSFEKRGIIAISATIGKTNWDGSLLPWADGSAQLSVKRDTRTKEKLELGQKVYVCVNPRN